MNTRAFFFLIAGSGLFLTVSSAGQAQNRPKAIPATWPVKSSQTSHARLKSRDVFDAGCPNFSGDLSAVGVPVGQSITLVLDTSGFGPAPPGGLTFDVSSDNNSIVAVGNATGGFSQQVFTPEGQLFTTP